MGRMTYKTAGVDIDKANLLVKDYRRLAAATRTKGVLGDVGSFGGFFKPDLKKFREPVLVSSTDGVGTKLKIAFLVDRHDSVGIDLVAMSVNDILCSGAEGLFFLDYISTGKIRPRILKEIVTGIARGCREAGYALIGGETAEMPGMYREDEYDVAGFAVGIVEKREIIDGSSIRPGDLVVGLESNGLHSNGYSLVRKVFREEELRRYSKELLKPTRLYPRPVLAAKRAAEIKGIAHITGGAFYDKIPRIIPNGMAIEIEKESWRIPPIFSLIKKRANLDDREMYRTFNMGIGMVLVVSRGDANKVRNTLKKFGLRSHVIGKVVRGKREVCVY